MLPIINQFKKDGNQPAQNKKSLSIQRTKRDSLKLTNIFYAFLVFDLGSETGFATKGSAVAIHAAGPPAT